MKTLFSTEDEPGKDGFRAWREAICDRFAPVEQRPLDDSRFQGRIQAAALGELAITRVFQGAILTEVTANTIRKDPKQDGFSVLLKLQGGATVSHYENDQRLAPGDVVIIDRSKPAVLTSTADSSSVLFELPRYRLESEVGNAANYAGLLLDRSQPGVRIMRSFLEQFTAVFQQMDPDTATRMSTIGTDLLLAALAERLSRENSQGVSATLTVQRAKAFTRVNLSKVDLDPHAVAAAVGISTRRLQELFHQRGHGVSEWIWQQRCRSAAAFLRDRRHAHLSIAEVAHRCGFTSESHFSRRFKEAEGASPREFRARAWQAESDPARPRGAD